MSKELRGGIGPGKALGIVPGTTRADGKAYLETARCFGACGLAPACIFDGKVAGNVTTEIGPGARERMAGAVELADLQEMAQAEKNNRKRLRVRCCTAASCLSSGSKAVKEALDQELPRAAWAIELKS